MYIVNTETKRLIKAQKCTFKSLNLKERQDLQEWIANEPSSLGEDLMIIQKEFAGFADTKERLDLLALDKKGNLVIIENKLDDSGKDVTWQALKYASYCSSLSKQDIINIYQAYLGASGNAVESLCEFYDGREIDDIELNKGTTGIRIFLVAANFHKEVTSTVLWLHNYNLRITCFKVTPFTYNGQLFVDFDQIIPIKDAEDYTIKIANKKMEEEEAEGTTAVRLTARRKFWDAFIEYNKEHHFPYANPNVIPDLYLRLGGIGISGVSVGLVLAKDKCRAEAYIDSGDRDKNKHIFDFLYSQRAKIDTELPSLVWQRLDDRNACRIRIDKPLSYLNPEEHQKMFDFLISASIQMQKVLTKYGKTYQN